MIKSPEEKARELMSVMSLEEKMYQLLEADGITVLVEGSDYYAR